MLTTRQYRQLLWTALISLVASIAATLLMPVPSKAGCPAVAIPGTSAYLPSVRMGRCGCALPPPAPAFTPPLRQFYTEPYVATFGQRELQMFGRFNGFNQGGQFQFPNGALDLRSSNENAAERKFRQFEPDGGRGTFIGGEDARSKVLGL